MSLNFTPEAQPSEFGVTAGSDGISPSRPESSQLDKLGMEVSALDTTVAEQLGMKGIEGVLITNVRSGGLADRAGLASGMVITQVNRHAVKSLDEFTAAVKKGDSSDGLLLLVRSQEGSRFVVVK
jgi:serine protease Do